MVVMINFGRQNCNGRDGVQFINRLRYEMRLRSLDLQLI